MQLPDLETFLTLPTSQIAEIVSQSKRLRLGAPTSEVEEIERRQVCVFPIDGTRRWHLLEHTPADTAALRDPAAQVRYLLDYLDRAAESQLRLLRLFFEHGIHTLLTSFYRTSLLPERLPIYLSLVIKLGLAKLAQPPFLQLYEELGIRVRFYGDYALFDELERLRLLEPEAAEQDKALAAYLERRGDTAWLSRKLTDILAEIVARTAGNKRHLFLGGLFADAPLKAIIQLVDRFKAQHGRLPDRRELVAAYYGEYVGPVDLYIGFDKPHVFDVPLLDLGEADLYFTVAPSPYLTAAQLRRILFDHLFSRQTRADDYTRLSPDAMEQLRAFYTLNRESVLGLGCRHATSETWYPTPQVQLPPDFA